MDNSSKVKLRRYEDDLRVCGRGVIILGVWSVLKLIMQILMDPRLKIDMSPYEGVDKAAMTIAYAVVIEMVIVLAVIIFLLHLYIGRNASKAAKGQPHKKGYYTCAIVLTTLTAVSMLFYIEQFKDLKNIDTTIASVLIDLTTIYIFMGVVISTRRIKELRPGPMSEQTPELRPGPTSEQAPELRPGPTPEQTSDQTPEQPSAHTQE